MEVPESKVLQMRSDLTPEKIQQFMSALANHANDHPGKNCLDLDSPPPTDEELQQFLDYMEAGVLNEDRLEYEERRRSEQDQPSKRSNKTASMYFYRPRYLSMIQEEEDAEHPASGCTTPRNSVASSIYESIIEGEEKDWSREANGGSDVVANVSIDAENVINTDAENVKRRKSRCSNVNSSGSEVSLDSLASINSILSDESSLRSCSTMSRRSVEMFLMMGERGEASTSLSHILRQLPPPPKGPPSATPPPTTASPAIIQSEEKLSEQNNLEFSLEKDQLVCEVDVTNTDGEVEETDRRTKTSLFERQMNDMLDSTAAQRKRQKVEKTTTSKGSRLRKLFGIKSDKNSVDTDSVDTTLNIRSEPSSPSTLRRFFSRPSLQKSSSKMSRSETSLNAAGLSPGRDKNPKIMDSPSIKKKLKRSKSLNDGQSSEPKVEIFKLKSTNPFEDSDDEIVTSERKPKEIPQHQIQQRQQPGQQQQVQHQQPQIQQQLQHQQLEQQQPTQHQQQQINQLWQHQQQEQKQQTQHQQEHQTQQQYQQQQKPQQPIYQSVICERLSSNKNEAEIERLFGGIVEKRGCRMCLSSGSCCIECKMKQKRGHRVVSIYDNIDVENNNVNHNRLKPTRKVTVSELIAECEDYVKTEQFTRDLSSEILNMFLQERSNHVNTNPFENDSDAFTTPPATPPNLYETASNIEELAQENPYSQISEPSSSFEAQSCHQSFPKFPFLQMDSRDSFYENGERSNPLSPMHEESPVDSAYGSDPKQEFEDLGSNLVSSFGKMSMEEMRSPSSCSDISSVSTIKRADSVNYDSVISDFESAMSDIEETMSHLSRRSRSLTPTFLSGTRKHQTTYGDGFNSWNPESLYSNDEQEANNRQKPYIRSKRIESSLTLPPKSKVKRKEEKYLGYTSLDRNGKFSDKRSKEDRQIGSIAAVFDELKDYLSDSDLSLDYKIALRRRKNRCNQNYSKRDEFVSNRTQFAAIEFTGDLTPALSERSDSRQRMREYAESVLSLNDESGLSLNPNSRSGSEDSWRGGQTGPGQPHSFSYSAPSTPVGPRRNLDSRYRRSPSLASEISSLLDPIPEEEPAASNRDFRSDIIRRDVTRNDVIKSDFIENNCQKLELIRQSKAAARQEFFKDLMIPKTVPEYDPSTSTTTATTTALLRISGENLTQTRKFVSKNSPEKTFGNIINSSPEDQTGLSSTLPRSGSSDYGSLKRRKTLKSASLSSLLQNREEIADESTTLNQANPIVENPTEKLNPSNPLILSRSCGTGPITFTSSVKVQYKTRIPIQDFSQQNETRSSKESDSGIFWARQWNSNEEKREQVQPLYGQKQFSRPSEAEEEDSGPVMVKQCSCGQKITFDPISESWPISRSVSTSSVNRLRDLAPKNNDEQLARKNNDGYSTDSDISCFKTSENCDNIYFAYPVALDPDLEEGRSPPRPPPPENYDLPPEWSYYSLPRKIESSAQPQFEGGLRKSASTSQVANREPGRVVFPTPFDRFMTSPSRQFDFQKVAG